MIYSLTECVLVHVVRAIYLCVTFVQIAMIEESCEKAKGRVKEHLKEKIKSAELYSSELISTQDQLNSVIRESNRVLREEEKAEQIRQSGELKQRLCDVLAVDVENWAKPSQMSMVFNCKLLYDCH